MIARITNNQFISLEQVVDGIEECIINWFSVREPNSYYMDTSSGWDGWYRRYNVSKQRLALPFLTELKICCDKNDIPLEVVDERPAPRYLAPQEEQITNTLIDGITLMDYQVRALRASCHSEIGLFSASTGSGKTELICGLVQLYRCPTIIITEQIVVLEQIVERLKLRKVVHADDIGMFCFGHMPDNNLVIVGSIQSISTPKKPKKADIKLKEKSVLEKTLLWINKERVKRDQPKGKFICRCGKTFKSKSGMALHKKKCTGDSESDLNHLSVALPLQEAEKLIEDDSYLLTMPNKYMNLLLDYHRDLEWDKRSKWYKTRLAKAKSVQELVKSCDMLLVDEADLATSQQYARMFKYLFNGRRRFGFSGTTFDKSKPVQNLLLKEHLGSVIFEAKREEVEAAGRIVPITYYCIGVGLDGNKFDARTYDIATKEDIIDNDKFHRLVCRLALKYPDEGTMILIDTSPIKPLGATLERLIEGSKFIYGETPVKEREKYINLFERRELRVLIGSKILKRGLDLEGGCENLIIIGGGAKWSDFTQKVGRSVRLNKRGRARVFGFFFLSNKYLYRHSRENLKALVDMGYPAKVLLGRTVIDGQKFIKSRFRIPKSVRT
jgi:superfamily II DNA or RNA helicase